MIFYRNVKLFSDNVYTHSMLFLKYIFVFILFIFTWVCFYNPALETIGFGSLVTVQTVFTLFILFDIRNDDARSGHAVTIPKWNYSIPLWWVLVPASILYLTSTTLMAITVRFLWKQVHGLHLSQTMRQNFNIYKGTFIAGTLLTFFLVLGYTWFGSVQSGFIRLVLVFSMIGSLVFAINDVVFANEISKLLGSTVDG